MSLQFYFGGSGVGKSRKIHEDIIRESMENPKTNYLVIVPDQFTMQTQMDFVNEHPNHGIMNIDVLSFGRLAHRVLEEVGANNMPLLDDTGKSLILRRLAKQMEDQLPALGTRLRKIGYIHEVKSIISEFMQYGISPDGVHELWEYAGTRGALKSKLADLELLYRAFLAFIEKQYLTKEETLGLLQRSLHKSEIIKDSVIVFDGFTGFTPIQYQVIQEMLVLAKEVKMTVILNGDENPYEMDGEQKLFHLSKKTVSDLKKLADRASIPELPPVLIMSHHGTPQWAKEASATVLYNVHTRFENNAELRHLENHLLRYPIATFEGEIQHIHLTRASTISEEIRETCLQIKRLIREKKLQYRDIAVVSGDLAGYAHLVEQIFREYDIPIYMDYTRAIMQNPFTRYVLSAMKIAEQNFSKDAMLQYLRCGMSPLTDEEIDQLENYLIKCGIKGKTAWMHPFARKGKGKADADFEDMLAQMNQYRERILEELEPLLQKANTAKEYIQHLYAFFVQNRCQEKLDQKAKEFEAKGDLIRAKEYGQIYRLIIDLLDQMHLLLENESIDYADFSQIFEAGLGELKVGTIPGEVDRVLIGDMERTRLKEVKVLFFLGINDGNIPRGTSKGGLISDIDREFLQQSVFELAPTPRQQMYIQRLYLYMNMTKPSQALYLSYATMDEAGKTLQPSYLIGTVRQMFPQIQENSTDNRTLVDAIECEKDVKTMFAVALNKYAANQETQKYKGILQSIYQTKQENVFFQTLLEIAFATYQNTPLARKVAEELYGHILAGSVSRLETYATCAYAHFLQYGLALKEREEFSFEAVDLGNIYHDVLEDFGKAIVEKGYTWLDFPEEFAKETIDFLLENEATKYGDTVLYSTARMKNSLGVMGRILKRSVTTMKEQLNKGSFVPNKFEMSFQKIESLEDIELGLTQEEKIRLRGRVDRVDTFEEGNSIYVKVLDYKSGNRDFDLAAVYYGLQLQLVVYMNAMQEAQKKDNPDKDIVPAAMLYYHVDDPIVEEAGEMSEEEIAESIKTMLTTKGVVNADEHVVDLLHHELQGKSEVIPVKIKKDGSYDGSSDVLNPADLQTVTNYVNHKIRKMGQEILLGAIDVSPFEKGNGAPCSYCQFRQVCNFDERAGYSKRTKEKRSEEEILEDMRKQVEDNE